MPIHPNKCNGHSSAPKVVIASSMDAHGAVLSALSSPLPQKEKKLAEPQNRRMPDWRHNPEKRITDSPRYHPVPRLD